jgi:3',5'-cyclic AMP phosphodiesterase CpdA
MTAAFTLAHLSDPHLPPLPAARLRDLAGKRALGYLNWTRNRHKYHRREVLDALVADMKAQQPDHIAVTGDLVNLALEAEFAPARTWLESVGTPQEVTVIPGNHDAYVRGTRHHFAGTFEKYLRGDAGADSATFPPARTAGAGRRILGGADAAADGDRPARPRAARCAGPASGAIVDG